jgi:CDP-4-dehydro-6-deoxyglucose reductase
VANEYKVIKLSSICSNIVEAVLVPNTTPLAFRPGQYVRLSVGALSDIPCSIANVPNETGQLVFQLRESVLTQAFSDYPTNVQVTGPFGCWSPDPKRPYLLLAGGTGIAPFFSLLPSLLLSFTPVHLYWGVRKPDDLYYLERLKAHELQGLTWLPVVSHETTHWTGRTGWVHEVAAQDIPDFTKYQVFASGPFDMVEQAFHQFTQQQLDPQSFYSDMRAL